MVRILQKNSVHFSRVFNRIPLFQVNLVCIRHDPGSGQDSIQLVLESKVIINSTGEIDMNCRKRLK